MGEKGTVHAHVDAPYLSSDSIDEAYVAIRTDNLSCDEMPGLPAKIVTLGHVPRAESRSPG
jgi:hypothetical protein